MQPFQQPFRRIDLTVIFADIFLLIFNEFCIKADQDPRRQQQFRLQNFMIISFLFDLFPIYFPCHRCHKTIFAMLFTKVKEPGPVYDDSPVFPQQSGTGKAFLSDQALHHLFSYICQTLWRKAFQIIIQCIRMRHF